MRVYCRLFFIYGRVRECAKIIAKKKVSQGHARSARRSANQKKNTSHFEGQRNHLPLFEGRRDHLPLWGAAQVKVSVQATKKYPQKVER